MADRTSQFGDKTMKMTAIPVVATDQTVKMTAPAAAKPVPAPAPAPAPAPSEPSIPMDMPRSVQPNLKKVVGIVLSALAQTNGFPSPAAKG